MRRKRLFAVILSLTMFSIFFTGCGEVEQTNKELTIAYWGDYDFSVPAIEKYRKLFPNVKVNTDFSASNGRESFLNYLNKQQAELMAGKGPDVVIFKNTFSIEKMMRSGVFADMSPFFEVDDEFNINDYINLLCLTQVSIMIVNMLFLFRILCHY